MKKRVFLSFFSNQTSNMNKILLTVIRCTRVLLTTRRPLAADGVPERSEAYANGRMFDISHRVAKDLSSRDSKDGLGQFLFPLASIKNGSDVNASETKMSVRTGTHVNAPSHMFYNYSNAGFDADSLDLQVLNGNPKSCPFFLEFSKFFNVHICVGDCICTCFCGCRSCFVS